MQHHNMIVITNLVDEMGRPKDAYAFVSDKGPYDLEDPGPGLDVESAVGSSSSNMRGRWRSARAISTRRI